MATNNGDIRITISEEHTGVSQQYVDGKVALEATARQDADTAVTAAMTALVGAETNARTSAVNAETTARETADSVLSARITDNANGIQANANGIASEAATRASEDARIEAVIASNEQATAATIRGLNSTISANDTASRERDSALDSKIDAKDAECVARVAAERQEREASEALIRSYVDAKTAGALHYKGTVATVAYLPQTGQVTGDMYNVQADGQNYAWDGTRWDSMGALIDLDPLWAGINANESAISEEAIARQSADSTLQNNINTEASNRQSGDATLQSNIEAEATARQSADATLQNRITAENTRATSAEGALNTAITTEASNRQAADATLRAELEAEISQKTSAQIAADFEQVKAKLNAVADLTDTSGFWVFAVTDADGNVTFGQTINGEIINALAL